MLFPASNLPPASVTWNEKKNFNFHKNSIFMSFHFFLKIQNILDFLPGVSEEKHI